MYVQSVYDTIHNLFFLSFFLKQSSQISDDVADWNSKA